MKLAIGQQYRSKHRGIITEVVGFDEDNDPIVKDICGNTKRCHIGDPNRIDETTGEPYGFWTMTLPRKTYTEYSEQI